MLNEIRTRAVALATLPEFRRPDTCSHGIAGVSIGFAAQHSIATIIAGFQITLTYVFVRIWDLRRLVREKIIGWLQKNHAERLPRLRACVLPAAPGGLS